MNTFIAVLAFVYIHEITGQNYPPFNGICSYAGRYYIPGHHWVSLDGCNSCHCTEWGVSCTADSANHCYGWGTTLAPSGPFCHYAMKNYGVGEVFHVYDGCNSCVCKEHGMTCTSNPCLKTGFAEPVDHGYIGDCTSGGRWYRLGDQYRAPDACNTCVCLMPGNYQGYQACTSMTCH